jgi:predicted nucleic acid-binding protein
MYLLDTNVWLERLLAQQKADEVGRFLEVVSSDQLHISDFSFHSICIILTRLKKKQALIDFARDIFIDGAVGLLSVKPEKTQSLVDAMDSFNLDFDDAYQYVLAETNDLALISFDEDFNRTKRGKKTPTEILSDISNGK